MGAHRRRRPEAGGRGAKVAVLAVCVSSSALFAGAAQARAGVFEQANKELTAVVRQVQPSVVAIRYVVVGPGRPKTALLDASGVVIDAQGHVVTVGLRRPTVAERVTAVDWQGREHDVEYLHHDQRDDLALLRVRGGQFTPIVPAAALPAAGAFVVMVGNAHGESSSVAVGNVGHVGRRVEVPGRGRRRSGLIQFSAPVSPGDAGACLADMSGKMIGLVSASLAGGRRSVRVGPHGQRTWTWRLGGSPQAVSFAVPIARVLAAVKAMKSGQERKPGYLGVFGSPPLPDDLAGARIASVIPGTPADKAGLRAGDVVVRFGAKAISSFDDLRDATEGAGAGAEVKMHVMRDGARQELAVTLGERPPHPSDQGAWPVQPPFQWAPGMPIPHQLVPRALQRQPLMLGVRSQALTQALRERLDAPADKGVLVTEVIEDSPAARAGLQPLDIVLKVGARETNSPEGLVSALAALKPGAQAAVEYLRDGKAGRVTVELGQWKGGRLWMFDSDDWPLPWGGQPGKKGRQRARPPRESRDLAPELRKQIEKMRREMEELRRRLLDRPGPATQPS